MPDEQPQLASWNLALRFVLEVLAWTGAGVGAWHATTGGWRWIAAAVATAISMTLWVVFRVPGDTSANGKSPVPVSGRIRLVLEIIVFGAGWWGWSSSGWSRTALVFAIGLLVHHVAGWPRVQWLLTTDPRSTAPA